MIEEPWFLPTLIGTVIFLQLLVLVFVVRLSARVSSLSRRVGQRSSSLAGAELAELAERKEATSDQKKWFAEFLAEDPSRGELPKKEQFAAFRQWREEKGLNWKGSAESA